jgi:hypothetical protein
VAQGVPGRLGPRIFLTFGTNRDGRSSALRTGRLYPRRNPWYSFSESESTSQHMVPSVSKQKIPSDTTGNRSRERPTISAVIQTVTCTDVIMFYPKSAVILTPSVSHASSIRYTPICTFACWSGSVLSCYD